jgi:acetylornithine/succinyldiaminopimelate/putrescine aminotransferase
MGELTELPAYRRLSPALCGSRGAELVLEDGTRALDLYGGHCVNTLGAGDPGILRAITRQWRELSFTTNLFDTHARERFLAAFGANLPPGDWSVFLSNSGAEANENALKAALHATARERVIAFRGAFHGRTAAAAAVSDTKLAAFPRAPFDVRRIPFDDCAAAERAIDDSVAAVILEPIQSLAGVVTPGAEFLRTLRVSCDRSGAQLLFDEVQTGNGRLGTFWASQRLGVVPDAFTTAKGAAGGLPIGITVFAAALARRFPASLCGSTFGGGPTVLAAATEVSERLARPGFLANVEGASLALRRAALRGPVRVLRGLGLLLGLELEAGIDSAATQRALLSAGVLVGTSDDPRVLRLSPPLDLEPRRAARLSEALESLEIHAR